MSSSPASQSPRLLEEVGVGGQRVPPSSPGPVLSGPGRVQFSLAVHVLLESMYLSPYFRRLGT